MNALFSAQTANGNSSAITHRGGPLLIVLAGTWDTSTMTVQVSPDGGTTYVAHTAKTADAVFAIDLPAKCLVRLNLASVGAGTSVSGWVGQS